MAEYTDEDDALLDELGVEVETQCTSDRTPREERIIAGFEEIQRFFDMNGHRPQHGEDRNIFERLYAVRLDRLRSLPDAVGLLTPIDRQGLLSRVTPTTEVSTDSLDDDALLEELGVSSDAQGIVSLRHVRSAAEKRAAEDIADRTVCADFETFKPLFEKVKRDLKAGIRQIRPFRTRALDEIQEGAYFIVGGQTAYVESVGEEFTTQYERRDSRLRVIYDNGTESNVLQRSLQRALHRDEAARYITDPSAGPLFGDESTEDDLESGTIYVLRSKSDHPVVAANRDLLHKIGVTGGDVSTRLAGAKLDPTFLLADVDVVATYSLYNVNRIKLENLLHRVLDGARLQIEIKDRFGNPVAPREWFLVPIFVVDEIVERIKDGSITDFVYDPKSAKLIRAPAGRS